MGLSYNINLSEFKAEVHDDEDTDKRITLDKNVILDVLSKHGSKSFNIIKEILLFDYQSTYGDIGN